MFDFRINTFNKIISLVFPILFFTSCVELDLKQEISINKDGTGDSRLEISIAGQFASQAAADVKRRAGSIWSIVEENQIGEKQIIIMKAVFEDISELNDEMFNYSFSIERNLFKKKHRIEIFQNTNSELNFPVEIVINLPAVVYETNGERISEKQVKWNYQGLRKGTILSVETSSFALPDLSVTMKSLHEFINPVINTQRIIFQFENNLWTIDKNGANRIKVTNEDDAYYIDWYEIYNSSQIIYSTSRKEYSDSGYYAATYILNLENGIKRALPEDGRNYNISPLGGVVVYEKYKIEDADYGCCGKGVWLLNLKDNSQKELVNTIPIPTNMKKIYPWLNEKIDWYADEGFIWSENGKLITFYRNFGKDLIPCSYVIDLEKNTITPIGYGITRDIKDGKILFESWQQGRELYLYDTNTGERNHLSGNATFGQYSKNGDKVIYQMVRYDRDYGYYNIEGLGLIDIRTKNKSIINEGHVYSAKWSPDGNNIILGKYNNNNVELLVNEVKSHENKKIAEFKIDAKDPIRTDIKNINWIMSPRIAWLSPNAVINTIITIFAMGSIALISIIAAFTSRKVKRIAQKNKNKKESAICTNCGSQNPQNASFCIKCGKKLKDMKNQDMAG